VSIFPPSKGRLPQEEHDRRITEIAKWIVQGLGRREVTAKIREVFKLKKTAPVWYKRTLQELAKDQPDIADLRTEAVEKARELYRKAYSDGNISEANKALGLLAKLTGMDSDPGDGAKEVVVRFASAADPAPATKPGA
jgi:hypothetical protein